MKMKKSLLASLAVASTIGFFTPLTSQAFGLGKLELMSALNEPFKAEIDVTALRSEEKENLQVRLASNDEFSKAGLDRSMLLSQLQFDIVNRQGQTKILVTTKQAVKEPFLDFLLTATAGSGRLIREYTVLLDPPAYVMAESRSTASAAPSSQTTTDTSSSSTTTRYQYAESSYAGTSYDVKRSDTLWNVALKTRPDKSVSVHQMMMALLKENPSAFRNGNVNDLMAGVTLQIPSKSQATALSKSAAAAAFAEQSQAWKNRNTSPASTTTVTETELDEQSTSEMASDSTTETASDFEDTTSQVLSETETETELTESAVSSENDGRLQLVAPEDDVTSEDDAALNVAGDDQITKLTEQLTLAQETIEMQQQENVDFEARMDAMEEQLETMRRLISIKDADLARLQSTLEEEDPNLAAELSAELQSDDSDSTTMPADIALNNADMESADNVTEVAEEPTDVAEQTSTSEIEEDNLISDATQALNLDEEKVQSLIDKVKQFVNENKLQTALGLLLILFLLLLIARRSKREVTWDEAVQKLDKDQPDDTGPVVVAPISSKEDSVTDAPLEDETDTKTVGALVEQADMFVGYADYVQAKNALEQARLQEPENTLVAYKLLFVLYKQQSSDEFIAVAEEANFEQDSFEWNEIKQWGQELAPNHELFVTEPPQSEVPENEFEADLEADPGSFDDEDKVDNETTLNVDDSAPNSQSDEHIEFDLNDFTDTPEQEASKDDAESVETDTNTDDDLLSFDTNLDPDEKVDNDEALELDAASDDEHLSFDLDDESPVEEPDMSELDLGSDSEDDTEIEFDVGDLDDIDEAETKLDLAAAYIDMDDAAGAESILNEVLQEGNEEQKNRARSLLDSLS
ncbi:FimV/HubP family polar landmark protein [Methylophaga sp.]|uniref:FimV/HubP family polar landmark protein n=1 Tax=Methylophaga sp. TaxID=2024840 RepID=UPI003F69980C